jgi:hypothetical protein
MTKPPDFAAGSGQRKKKGRLAALSGLKQNGGKRGMPALEDLIAEGAE